MHRSNRPLIKVLIFVHIRYKNDHVVICLFREPCRSAGGSFVLLSVGAQPRPVPVCPGRGEPQRTLLPASQRLLSVSGHPAGTTSQTARQPDTRPMSRYTLKRSTDQAACIICLFVFESTLQSCVKVYVYFQPKPLSQWFLHVLQFLLENSRMVNIFTDQVYSSFARQLDGVLSGWVPLLNTDGIMTPSHMYRSSFMYCTLHNC